MTLQTVSKALSVLRLMNTRAVSTVLGIHEATGIPKATVVRILRTFEDEGLVKRAAYGSYIVTSSVRALSNGYHDAPELTEHAAPVLEAYTADIKWPSFLAVFEKDHMVIRYATSRSSPLSQFHAAYGMHLDLTMSAAGRAYLAFCDADERALILAARASADGSPPPAQDFDRLMQSIRKSGHATREAGHRSGSQSLAVPVFDGGRVAGSIGLTWFTSVLKDEAAVKKFAQRTTSCAIAIAKSIQRQRKTREAAQPTP